MKQMKQVGMVTNEVKERMQMLEHFQMFSGELREKGKVWDIARAVVGLRARAKELLEFDVFDDLEADRTAADVKLKSEVPVENVKHVFGEVKVDITIEGKKQQRLHVTCCCYSKKFHSGILSIYSST